MEGVIFDLDGVLIDSAVAHLESWRRLTAAHGLAVTERQFADSFGRQNRDILPMLWGRELAMGEITRLGDEKESIYRDLVRGSLAQLAMPGAVDLIRNCHEAGMKLAIGSSTPPQNVALALGELGVEPLFHALVTSSDVTRGKPYPDVFLLAARRLGIPPAHCGVIEDAPSGIEAAQAAGCLAIGLTSHHPRAKLAHAHVIVDALGELSALRLSRMLAT